MPLPGMILDSRWILTFRAGAAMSVSPHVISSQRASWMKTYWGCEVEREGGREGREGGKWEGEREDGGM